MWSRVAVAVLVSGLVAGCSSDDAVAPEGTDSPSAETSASPTEPTPVESTPPEVVPASGVKLTISDLDGEVLEYRLPESGDWEAGTDGRSANMFTRAGLWRVDSIASASLDGAQLGFYVKSRRAGFPTGDMSPRRVADREVDGVEGYVLESSGSDGLFYEYGAVHDDTYVNVQFTFPVKTPEARDVIESVLASATWL